MAHADPGRKTAAATERFEAVVVANLDAAYNFARWLTRNEHDAQDVVQEACLRAFRFLGTYRGGNDRAWLLAIVRNAYYTSLKQSHAQVQHVALDGDGMPTEGTVAPGWDADDGEDALRILEREDMRRSVDQALAGLSDEFREVIVLRELEEMSYQEIATIAQIPIGTVMSRLSRARKQLLQLLKSARADW